MSTAMASASTVEATTPAVESASTMEATSAAVVPATTMVPAAYEAVAGVTTSGIVAAASITMSISFMSVAPAPAGVPMAPTIAIPTSGAPTIMIPAAAIISAIPEPARMSPVIPRASADKHAVHEIVGTVIPVRRAGIRIIVIVPIRADWRTSRVGRTDPDPKTYLRLRIR